MKNLASAASIVFVATAVAGAAHAQQPPILGQPVIVEPDLLGWPDELPTEQPNLSEPTSNRLADFHGELNDCDIVLSTAGNYHMALKDLWQVYLHTLVDDLDIRNWFYTTSPPIPAQQIANEVVQFGNLTARCRPQVVVAPGNVINPLRAANVTLGAAVPIIRNHGNVILVKKGNPRHIQTIWDLGANNVTVVTPNPSEGGSFNNFTSTIFGVAAADPNPPGGKTAAALFDSIFNTDNAKKKPKWVAGKRIMHREIPWAIFAGKADAGVIFYHLARHAVDTFPDQFEIVPLGGTATAPVPLPGNNVAVLQAIRIAPAAGTSWTAKQLEASARLMAALQSDTFTEILLEYGLRRP